MWTGAATYMQEKNAYTNVSHTQMKNEKNQSNKNKSQVEVVEVSLGDILSHECIICIQNIVLSIPH